MDDLLALGDDVLAGDAHIHVALAHEHRDVRGGQEDDLDRHVGAQSDVDSVGALILEPGSLEELEALFMHASLFGDGDQQALVAVAACRDAARHCDKRRRSY